MRKLLLLLCVPLAACTTAGQTGLQVAHEALLRVCPIVMSDMNPLNNQIEP